MKKYFMGKTKKIPQRTHWLRGLLFVTRRRRQKAFAFALMFTILGYGTVLITEAATATPPASSSGIILQPVEVAYCQITMSSNCHPQSANFPFPYQVKVYSDSANSTQESKLVYAGNLVGPNVARITLAPGTYDVHYSAGTLPIRFLDPVAVSADNYAMQQLYFSDVSADPRGLFTDYNGCSYSLVPGASTSPLHCTSP